MSETLRAEDAHLKVIDSEVVVGIVVLARTGIGDSGEPCGLVCHCSQVLLGSEG